MHHPALGTGLVRHQLFAQQVLCRLADLVLSGAELDAARLAPGTGMDLCFDGPARSADFRGAVDRLFRTVGHAAAGNGNTETGEQLFGLVLVDVHSSFRRAEIVASGVESRKSKVESLESRHVGIRASVHPPSTLDS